MNAYRIEKFTLAGFVDLFVSSCFVHLHKPDADNFRLALDIAQKSAGQIVYIENASMFIQVAEGLGIRSILHTDYQITPAKLARPSIFLITTVYPAALCLKDGVYF